MPRKAALTALLFVLPAAGSTATWGPFQLRVPPRGLQEHCLELPAGETIRYRFRASASVDFNIHYHRGSEVITPVVVRQVESASGDFSAPHADTYCLMWERASESAVDIDGAVDRVAR